MQEEDPVHFCFTFPLHAIYNLREALHNTVVPLANAFVWSFKSITYENKVKFAAVHINYIALQIHSNFKINLCLTR